jgi:hypothetical protein
MGTGADAVAPSRFPSPLIKPDMSVSGIRLFEWFHCKLTNEAPAALAEAGRHPIQCLGGLHDELDYYITTEVITVTAATTGHEWIAKEG